VDQIKFRLSHKQGGAFSAKCEELHRELLALDAEGADLIPIAYALLLKGMEFLYVATTLDSTEATILVSEAQSVACQQLLLFEDARKPSVH